MFLFTINLNFSYDCFILLPLLLLILLVFNSHCFTVNTCDVGIDIFALVSLSCRHGKKNYMSIGNCSNSSRSESTHLYLHEQNSKFLFIYLGLSFSTVPKSHRKTKKQKNNTRFSYNNNFASTQLSLFGSVVNM